MKDVTTHRSECWRNLGAEPNAGAIGNASLCKRNFSVHLWQSENTSLIFEKVQLEYCILLLLEFSSSLSELQLSSCQAWQKTSFAVDFCHVARNLFSSLLH
jgi:hypothetical protein